MPIQARWLIPEGNAQEAQALAAALGIRLPAARVLLTRELGDPEAARRFLNPSLADCTHQALCAVWPRPLRGCGVLSQAASAS